MKTLKTLTIGFLVFATQSLFAIESDQLRGTVVSANDADRSLTIEITETGDNVTETVGATETYIVPDNVQIEYEIDRLRYTPYADFRFSDIRSGDTVLLDFDENSQLLRFRNENTSDVAIRDRVRTEGRLVTEDDFETDNQYAANLDNDRNQRSQLPDSASALPLFAVLGLMFAGLAGALRLYRS